MKIYLGSDHGGFAMKNLLRDELIKMSILVEDCGCFSEDSVDYPDIALLTCQKILSDENSLGLLLCGTGLGISISANKINGIRATLCHNEYMAKMAREHNNANVLCLGGRVIGFELAKSIVQAFLSAKFQAGRHQLRVDKISQLEVK